MNNNLTPGKKTLWIISEVFYPDQVATAHIITEIAAAVSEQRPVSVICGPPSYEKEVGAVKERGFPGQLHIQRVWAMNLDKNKLFSRTVRMMLLTISMGWKLLRDSRHGDDVFMPTNPAFLLLLVGWIARWKRLRLFILVHDVFPENAVAAGVLQKGSILLTILRNLFNRAYSMCDTLIVIGRDMEQIIRQKLKHQKAQPLITVIENWSDNEDVVVLDNANNSLQEELGIRNKIVFGYTGNLGRVQGLMSLLDVINSVKNTSIHALFIGGGAMKPEMQRYISENGITNVSMIGQMPRTEQNNFLSACDVGIVTLADNMLGLGVPSKSYNIMAAGRPILYIGNRTSEIALMISEAGNGWIFEPTDREGLIAFFESVDHNFATECIKRGRISRELAETRYARKVILHKFQTIFQ